MTQTFNFTTNIEKRMPTTGEVFFVDRMTSDYAVRNPFDVDAFIESVFQKYEQMAQEDAYARAMGWNESACLRRIEEDLCYSEKGLLRTFPRYFNAATAKEYARKPAKIANRVYANRMGNGSEASGDGYRFRGRGLLQLTGRENYQAYADSKYCQGDLMAHPDWLAQFPGAVKSALWYWQKRGLNALADSDDILAVTRRINGGQNGLEEREYLTMKFKGVLGL